MKALTILRSMLLLLMLALSGLSLGASDNYITVSSTTSTEQSGLFGFLLPQFEKATGISVRVVALGTGQALDMGRRGDADVVFVHDKAAEEKFIAEGFGVKRHEVMYNDFILVGPKDDPAKVAGGKEITEALKKIEASKQAFVSRGDKSGTHAAELRLWKAAGIEPSQLKASWYRDTGSGMGPALNTAASLNGYILVDRGTWLSFKNRQNLVIVVEGDKRLFNQYGVIAVNPAKYPHVKQAAGQKFIDWLVSEAGQKVIAEYKIGGEQLFFPNAKAQTTQAEKPEAIYGSGQRGFSLATGSPGELGLIKVLAEEFCKDNDATLRWFKAGTGKSLSLLKEKKVDLAMVHAPAEVEKALVEGWATGKTLIGSNEFYIVGPKSDAAKITKAKDSREAYRRIAQHSAKWVSRGDNSGTHQKELQLWKAAGVTYQGQPNYIVTKDFMIASLKRANAEGAYFMTDSSTWIMEKNVAPELKVLFRGDKALVNTYHALAASAGATPERDTAVKFIAFVASAKGQKIIREYGRERFGEALYNDARYAKKYE